MTDDAVIFARPCVNHPDLSVSVARTIIGTYRMVFRDDDAGAVIESRVFQTQSAADNCARILVNQP